MQSARLVAALGFRCRRTGARLGTSCSAQTAPGTAPSARPTQTARPRRRDAMEQPTIQSGRVSGVVDRAIWSRRGAAARRTDPVGRRAYPRRQISKALLLGEVVEQLARIRRPAPSRLQPRPSSASSASSSSEAGGARLRAARVGCCWTRAFAGVGTPCSRPKSTTSPLR
jgi:hypothetical protein